MRSARFVEVGADGRDFDSLAAAARGRSQADWLVGMNLSRAYTLACGHFGDETLSVGRVQTPTLAMVVDRDLAIRAFVPEDYQEVIAPLYASHPNPLRPTGEGRKRREREEKARVRASGFVASAWNPKPSACPPMKK